MSFHAHTSDLRPLLAFLVWFDKHDKSLLNHMLQHCQLVWDRRVLKIGPIEILHDDLWQRGIDPRRKK